MLSFSWDPSPLVFIFNSLCGQPVSPVTVSRPAARFRFRGCPPTSAGSASVRARKEAGRGAPRGSRAGPGLPRPRSRGTGGQGRSQGVGRERAVGTRCARRWGGRHLGSVTVNSCLRAGRRSDPFNAAASSERARCRLISEAKQGRAGLALGWETTSEDQVLYE